DGPAAVPARGAGRAAQGGVALAVRDRQLLDHRAHHGGRVDGVHRYPRLRIRRGHLQAVRTMSDIDTNHPTDQATGETGDDTATTEVAGGVVDDAGAVDEAAPGVEAADGEAG